MILNCIFFFNHSDELMKKLNGTYFPEEVWYSLSLLFIRLKGKITSNIELIIILIAPQKLLKWFAQLVLAVDYLHSNYVLHRDLKVSISRYSHHQLSVFRYHSQLFLIIAVLQHISHQRSWYTPRSVPDNW
jgi:serine/threonine protein kinase